MSVSVLRATGRLLLPVTAAVLLAGVSLEAGAYGSKGRIAFETGKVLDGFHFTLEKEQGAGNWVAVSGPVRQGFSTLKGCTIIPKTADPELVRVMPYRGTSAGTLGYVSTSLGVYDGPQGTACGRVSESKSEALSLAVGSAIQLGDANAFDRLELDLEVKGDVTLKLEVDFHGSVRTYTLLAGSAQVGGNPTPPGTVFNPTNSDVPFKCSAASDSGPDSGPSDNCRWIIEDVGTSFKITPKLGEFSFEGGGDYAGSEAFLNRTFIYLTRADGILNCGDSRETGDAAARIACSITRLDAPGETCVPVPYVFRTDVADDGTQSCIFEADMGTQQLVANIFTSYGLETQEDLTDDLPDLGVWQPRPLSKIHFNINGTPAYDIPPCLGLTLTGLDVDAQERVGPGPINEIYDGGADGLYDRVKYVNDTIEFACAFMRREVFETVDGFNTTRVSEGIQFWGDPQLSRPGGGFSN